MATLEFKTASPIMVGKIEYSYTRSSTDYTINYEVFLRRTNYYTGDPTRGTINYEVHINNQKIKGSKYLTVSNDSKSWTSVCKGSETYDLKPLQTSSFTIGFASTTSGGVPPGYMVDLVRSDNNSVQAYATNAGKTTINISFSQGNNYFSLSGTIGTNGKNNKVTGISIYCTTDGTEPSPTNANMVWEDINGTEKTSWLIEKVLFSKNQTIKAVAYTKAAMGDVAGDIKTKEVYYYSPPTTPTNLNIAYGKKPSPKSHFRFEWAPSQNGYNNTVEKYNLTIFANDKQIKTIETVENFVEQLGEDLLLKKGDVLSFTVYSIGDSAYNNTSPIAQSSLLTIESASLVKIKIDNKWKEAQVWVKVEGSWREVNGVFIKNNGTWKSSV